MYNKMNAIIREATRNIDEPLNILTFVAHERYEPTLALTGHNFYSLITDGTRQWNSKYAPIPDNYIIYREQMPAHILGEIDVIISHNPFVHIQLAHQLGLSAPLINVFHTMPTHNWDNNNIDPRARGMFDYCAEHVYISEFNKLAWGYERGEVILHGIDTDLFKYATVNGPIATYPDRQQRVLTVANDYINRDWCLGFSIWHAIHQDLPMFPVGDTPGLSQAAPSLDEMIKIYQESAVFLNTSTASPIPMSLLEAMACGCACVSAATCMIPDIIEDGKDGFLCPPHKPEMFKERCKYLLEHKNVALAMGYNAREKIKSMFGVDRFVNEWNRVIRSVL